MKSKKYKEKLNKINSMVDTLNRLRNTPYYISLSRCKTDSQNQRRELHDLMYSAELRYKRYRSRVIQYISLFNRSCNMFQKINIVHYVDYVHTL